MRDVHFACLCRQIIVFPTGRAVVVEPHLYKERPPFFSIHLERSKPSSLDCGASNALLGQATGRVSYRWQKYSPAKDVEGFCITNSTLEATSQLKQIAAMHTQIDATKQRQLLPLCFPDGERGAGKHISRHSEMHILLILQGTIGAGEGIRTLDPDLGNRRGSRMRNLRNSLIKAVEISEILPIIQLHKKRVAMALKRHVAGRTILRNN